MTDADVPPDGIVRTALQLLPVPPHADDFWTRLDESLAGESTARRPIVADPLAPVLVGPIVASSQGEQPSDPALALVPRALRRTSNVLLVAVAAAAVVVVALAGSTLLDERSGTRQITSDDLAGGSEELETLVDGAGPGVATPSTVTAADQDASVAAVLAWVADLEGGRAEGAWEAMGADSQDHFGSLAAFEADLAAVAEEYGGWGAVEPDQVLVTPVRADDGVTIAVVTLVGTVTVDGVETKETAAFPVRLGRNAARLEPYATVGQLELVVPERSSTGPPSPVGSDEELILVVPDGVDAPVLRLDDGVVVVCGVAEGTELIPLEELPGQRCSYLPPEGIEPGAHTLTVAFMGADGASISAESLLFEAA